jgi:hypothetical protein
MRTVVPTDKDPYSNYDLDDWQWEFLRRNPRYIRAYRAVKRGEERGWGWEIENDFMFTADTWVLELRSHLKLSNPPTVDDPESGDDPVSLPNPDFPSHRYNYSPVTLSPAVVLDGPGEKHSSSDPILDEILGDGKIEWETTVPDEFKITVEIDARCKLDNILTALKKEIPKNLVSLRKHVNKYKAFLDAWDLWQAGLTDDQVSEKLWPDEYRKIGGRDTATGEKSTLSQRAVDHRKAAQKLIDASFPPKRRPRKIKK